MKKAALVLILFVLLITGCGGRATTDTSGVLQIRENMFLTQITDINLNPREYLGRTIRLEGFITRNHWNDRDYYFVGRTGPDCCGGDSNIGFQISWNPNLDSNGLSVEERSNFPEIDEWVEAIGVLHSYDFMGYPYMFLALSHLNVLEKRGIEYVTR